MSPPKVKMTGKLHPEAAELQKTLAIDEGASKLGTVDMQVGSHVLLHTNRGGGHLKNLVYYYTGEQNKKKKCCLEYFT